MTKKIRIAVIIGTRPEIIKASIFAKELEQQDWIEYQIWDTGQHYDYNMSEVFYKELDITPNVNFGIGSGSHATQLSKLFIAVEKQLIEYKPDLVVLIGDTNSTMGVAFMAKRLNIPIAHIEAGCREFDVKYENELPTFSRNFDVMQFPEEVNRVITDRCSTLLFTATEFDLSNLRREDILGEYLFVGDITYDTFMAERERANKRDTLKTLNLSKGYNLITLHRAENTDDPERIKSIIEALIESKTYIVFPMHPRTKKVLESNGLLKSLDKNKYIRVIEPVGYLDMINLMTNANRIFTDSGGVQREAYFLRVPCVTLRNVSAWVELIKGGAIKIVGSDKELIIKELQSNTIFPSAMNEGIFGIGHASENIVQAIFEWATKHELVGKSYKRRKSVHALLAITSPRDIPEIKEKFDLITCVDKVWLKYMSLEEALKRIEDYFLSHNEYTHLILNSDDGVPSNEQIEMLIADIKEHNLPIIAGCCCIDKLTNDLRLSLTIDPVSNAATTMSWDKLNYRLLPSRFANKNTIIKVWFQGIAACCIRRDIVERVRLVYPEYDEKFANMPMRGWLRVGDLAFAYKCAQLGIPQYVDLRCYFEHYKYDIYTGVGKVHNIGERMSNIIFENATSKVHKKESVPIVDVLEEGYSFDPEKKHRIFIGIPVCNEGGAIERCIAAILQLNYPKELLDILFIENNSSDNSWEILQEAVKITKETYNYHSFEAIQDWGNYDKIPKGKEEWGTISPNRAIHLCHILNRIMDEAKDKHCDFCLTIMADSIVRRDTILYYLKVFEYRYDAGWAGGVLHKRFPHHEWDESKNPLYYGLASPTLKYNDGDPLPDDFNPAWVFTLKYMRGNIKNYPYSYGLRGMKENEVVKLRKILDPLPIIEVCCTGHVWMIRKELFDLRFDSTVVEAGLQFETHMSNRGYKMYAHLGVYIAHISIDGKVYHSGLVDEEVQAKVGMTEEEKQLEQQKVWQEPLKEEKEEKKQGPHP
jgi:UDP-GlcNAc3NAcA epimerase